MSTHFSTILEIRPGNGGGDAEAFATEIVTAITKGLTSSRHKYRLKPMSKT